MDMTASFKDIIAWQFAHQFVLLVYKLVGNFPEPERFALCPQFTRAAVSIPANIAEGYKKISRADKLRFMNIAQGSLEECRYYVLLSKDLLYINEKEYESLNDLLEKTSWYLNAYSKGILNNTGVD